MKNNAGEKPKIWPGAAVAAALCFLLFLYAPLELYLTNQLEFWFTAGQMLPYALLLFALGFAGLLLAFLLLRRFAPGLCPWALALCLLALICTWIQGSFLVAHLPGMNGAAVDWGAFPGDRLASILIWVLGAAGLGFALKKLGAGRFSGAAGFVSLALCLLLAVTLTTLFLATDSAEKRRSLVCTDEGLFTYSEDENFLILVLDAVDAEAFEQSLAREERYPGIFDDFTYYRNTVGGYPYSLCSIPLIISGEWYEAKTTFVEFETAALAGAPVLQRAEREGFRRGLYVYDPAVMAAAHQGQFENLTVDQPAFSGLLPTAKILVKMALVKHAPWDLKRFGYDLPGRLNEAMAFGGEGDAAYFDWSDLSFYRRLRDENPVVTVPEKCWKYIHLEGAHQPHVYDKNLNVLPDSPYRDVIEGNFLLVDTFLSRLREAGVYDNTVIVLCADHGSSNGMDLDTINQHPILLVKGKNERHPFRTDDAPISYDDLQQAYLKLMDGAQSDAIFPWHEGDARERRFFDHELNNSGCLTEYVQTGHAEDMETLRPTGRVFEYKG